MSLFIKLFNTTAEYNTYTADTENFILPNVSCAMDDLTSMHFNPFVETRVVAKFNVTDTSNPTQIASGTSSFTKIEIDGVELPSVTTGHTFSTIGEHTVKYTLADPTTIGESAFEECRELTSIVIPNCVTFIDRWVFWYCFNLTSCTMSSAVTNIGNAAFGICSGLTSIEIPSGMTSISNDTFKGCSGLTSINIPSGVTSIGDYAFSGCSGAISVNIPNSVTSIGKDGFAGCYSLTSIEIPSGVTSIGDSAFYYCDSLTSIISNATTAPTIQSGTFRNVKTGGTLRVPNGSSGYDVWMGTGDYYLGLYNWTKVEQ